MIGIGAYRTTMDYTRYVLFYMLRGMPCLGCIEFEYHGVHFLYPICFIAREGRAKHTFGAIYLASQQPLGSENRGNWLGDFRSLRI